MKLYLHIGSHKSGSSSIQSFIEDNQLLFLEAGVFIDESLTFKDQWKIAAWAGYPKNTDYFVNTLAFNESELRDLVSGYPEAFRKKLISAQKAKGFHSCIISSEFLYSQCSDEIAIENLAVLFKSVFSSVTILFYFRDQVSMAKSVYKQLVNGPAMASMSYEEFVETVTEDSVFNYEELLKRWAIFFGYENIKVAQLGNKSGCLQGEDLLLHFASSIKLRDQPFVLRVKVANQSPSFYAIQIIRYLNRVSTNKYFRISFNNIFLRAVKKMIKLLPIKGQFPKELDETIANRFKPSDTATASIFSTNDRK